MLRKVLKFVKPSNEFDIRNDIKENIQDNEYVDSKDGTNDIKKEILGDLNELNNPKVQDEVKENTNENPKKVLDPNELSLLKKVQEFSKETKPDENTSKVQMIEGDRDVKSMFGDNSKENKTNENVRRSSRIRKKIRYYKDESDENYEINNGMGVISTR